jgi:hypothetical protein
MTEASQNNTTPESEQGPIRLPVWLPPAVARQTRLIEARCSLAEHRAILRRLATDARMRGVWGELTRRKRKEGGFFHPAKPRLDKPVFKRRLNKPALTQEEVQAEALGELFHFAFQAACDRVPVSKPEDGAGLKAKLLENARILREIADDMAAITSAYPLAVADAAALRRVAGWHETGAAVLRPPSDPLTIQYDRGDRVVRGVQIVIAAHLRETFGKPLDGTAATLVSVAFDQPTSERVTRSAFSGTKRGVKRRTSKVAKRR